MKVFFTVVTWRSTSTVFFPFPATFHKCLWSLLSISLCIRLVLYISILIAVYLIIYLLDNHERLLNWRNWLLIIVNLMDNLFLASRHIGGHITGHQHYRSHSHYSVRIQNLTTVTLDRGICHDCWCRWGVCDDDADLSVPLQLRDMADHLCMLRSPRLVGDRLNVGYLLAG